MVCVVRIQNYVDSLVRKIIDHYILNNINNRNNLNSLYMNLNELHAGFTRLSRDNIARYLVQDKYMSQRLLPHLASVRCMSFEGF